MASEVICVLSNAGMGETGEICLASEIPCYSYEKMSISTTRCPKLDREMWVHLGSVGSIGPPLVTTETGICSISIECFFKFRWTESDESVKEAESHEKTLEETEWIFLVSYAYT